VYARFIVSTDPRAFPRTAGTVTCSIVSSAFSNSVHWVATHVVMRLSTRNWLMATASGRPSSVAFAATRQRQLIAQRRDSRSRTWGRATAKLLHEHERHGCGMVENATHVLHLQEERGLARERIVDRARA
jgi:hypothetical protein